MARRLLWASLALAPATILVDVLVHPGKTVLFVLAAVSLIPLAWLIGEATEHAGEHTGPRIGGLLNASFGNAPEVIIALIAVADNLPDVVRGSMAGSIVSNILLVLGAGLLVGTDNARLDRKSLLGQLGLVVIAVALAAHSLDSGLARGSEPSFARAAQHRAGRRAARAVSRRHDDGSAAPARTRGHGHERLEPAPFARRPCGDHGGDGADQRDPRPFPAGLCRRPRICPISSSRS